MRYRAPSRLRGLVMLSLLAMAMTGCGGDGARSGSASATSSPARSGPSAASAPPPELLGQRVDPARFQTTIDNPYLPLAPGTRLRYEGTSDEGPETVTVEVTRETKRILGVPTVVVRDRVTRGGRLVEDTRDWYAQDREGNVWYFGEDTKAYWHGLVISTRGSWEAGKDGAEPGIVMRAHPRVGDRYRQEYYRGVAEDMGEVLSVDERVTVPFGSFQQGSRPRTSPHWNRTSSSTSTTRAELAKYSRSRSRAVASGSSSSRWCGLSRRARSGPAESVPQARAIPGFSRNDGRTN